MGFVHTVMHHTPDEEDGGFHRVWILAFWLVLVFILMFYHVF